MIRRVGNVSQEIEQTAKGPLRPRCVIVMDTKWIENISKALADETRLGYSNVSLFDFDERLLIAKGGSPAWVRTTNEEAIERHSEALAELSA